MAQSKNKRWWMYPLTGVLMLGAVVYYAGRVRGAAYPGLGLTVDGGHATFVTERMTVEIRDGVISRIRNLVTGTDYIAEPDTPTVSDLRTGLIYGVRGVSENDKTPGVVGTTVTSKGTAVLVPTLRGLDELPERTQTNDAAEVTYAFRSKKSGQSLSISYSLDSKSGDVVVRQEGKGGVEPLVGVRLALPPVRINGDMLLPSLGGIKAAPNERRYQFESTNWQWPTGWMLPLVIFDDPAGGFWIHTKDTEHRFKSLRYQEQPGGTWGLALETENAAPFDKQHSAASVEWRINVYEGDWTTPLDSYRAWARNRDQMEEKDKHRPAWLSDLSLIVKHADYVAESDAIEYLDELAKHVDPKRTLLFNTEWIDGSQGLIMPHWVASERGSRFNREARKRGFRTLYFANYIGITPNHPRFADFEPYLVRNAYSGEHEGWNLKGEWSAENTVKLYYVNPAHKPWRDFQISAFKKLFEKDPADALFIDQTFLMFNDGNGTFDGQDMITGNIAYHRELTEALPGVAIGGESINEITAIYQSFWEHHPLSLHIETDANGKSMGWKLEPQAFSRMVPLLPRFTMPSSRPMGYLAFPETSSKFYEAWRDALKVYGAFPTMTKPKLSEMQDAQSEVRRVFREAMKRHEE